jgi:hypothetical protein
MRKPIITKKWLEDFYAEGVKPKYRGSLKHQAPSLKPQAIQAPSGKPQAPSTKLQASSRKRQAP